MSYSVGPFTIWKTNRWDVISRPAGLLPSWPPITSLPRSLLVSGAYVCILRLNRGELVEARWYRLAMITWTSLKEETSSWNLSTTPPWCLLFWSRHVALAVCFKQKSFFQKYFAMKDSSWNRISCWNCMRALRLSISAVYSAAWHDVFLFVFYLYSSYDFRLFL